MPSFAKIVPWLRQRRLGIAASSLIAVLIVGALFSRAQQSEPGSTEVAKVTRHVKPNEPEPRVGIIKQIDKGLGAVVEFLETVLFYRVGSRKGEYVVMDHREEYVRPAGETGQFRRLDPDGTRPELEITAKKAEGLAAVDQLIRGPEKNFIRNGFVDDKPVEFISIGVDTSTKYVLVKAGEGEGEYRKQLPKRQRLSDDPNDVLTPSEVERLASLERLKVDEEPVDSSRPYVFFERTGGVPLVVAWLVIGGIFCTIYFRGFNIRGFFHSLQVVRGKYDDPTEPGEVTHFQALSSALSATVGLGNIAGVTIAMTIGGPGAFFWMIVCGVLGMSSKFAECTLGQKYRTVKPDGTVQGGPMEYLYRGLKEIRLAPLGTVLSIAFAVMCVLASFGGGNMFQVNQSGSVVVSVLQTGNRADRRAVRAEIADAAERGDDAALQDAEQRQVALEKKMDRFGDIFKAGYGVVMAILVGAVIIGGIRRIGAAAEKIVPAMCLLYIAVCLYIILMHFNRIPGLFASVFTDAFTGQAFGGGLIGVIVVGFQRAAFSNEAGVGSAAIAHSAARTEEPVREGVVALMGPFIDTIVVCSMTAMVILITGAWNNEVWVVKNGLEGAALTARAFEEELSWFPYILAMAVVLFAYSTIISWSYYGERSWERLFGARTTIIYKVLCIVFVFVGAVANLGSVLSFSDMMILTMAFPNILGVILLAPKIKRDLDVYWRRYKAGEFKTKH